ncbi:MAG: hypothetical protein ACOCUI_02120, partial [bacterium]
MTTLKEHIAQLKQSDWDYYSDLDDKILKNPFNSKMSHNKFVNFYFKRYGKGGLLSILDILPDKKLNNNRLKHSNSIFSLGLLIYYKTNLKHEFFDQLNSPKYKRFPFIWFLTCLLHDFTFTIEKNNTYNISNIKDLKKKFSIDYCLMNNKPQNINDILFNSIENYFKYKLKIFNEIDHGILGGFLFYDRLTKIRNEKVKKNVNPFFWENNLNEQYAEI